MLGGKLFDSKDSGPYTSKNLDKVRRGETTVTKIIEESKNKKSEFK